MERRIESARQRKNINSVQYLRRENIIYSIQLDLDKLWNSTFEIIKKKSGTIRDKILGGRLNFSSRNVIVPDKDLRPDEIKLGYTTFLELYKLEIISILVNMLDIDHPRAWNIWKEATINFSEQIYKIMQYMTKHREIVCEINRNPTINYGSILAMKVKDVVPDIDDYTMSLPESVLVLLNADFDGDVLNINSLKIDSIRKEYYEKLNPMDNIFIDRNDGKYSLDASLIKDQAIGLYTFANI